MAGIFDQLLGKGTAEQLFLWSVVNQVVAAVLEPFFRAAQQDALALAPDTALSPAELASMVVRGHMGQADGETQASRSGLSAHWFDLLVKNNQNAPAPGALAEAFRRGIIPENGESDDAPGYIQGIREGDLGNKWSTMMLELEKRLPGPESAVTGAVRDMLSSSEARTLYEAFGGDPQFYDLMYNISGEGPSPVEAGVLANRNIIPWEGTGPDVTSFAQAVAESRFKTKWTKAYRELATYRPPPRTVTAMFREGSITAEVATQLLLNYGVTPDMVPTYLTKANKNAVAKAHEITEGEILRLYANEAITEQQAKDLLKAHGYPESDITYILQAAKIAETVKQENAAITIVKREYAHGKIDANTATTLLSTNQVTQSHIEYLLKIWDAERAVGTRDLSEKDILTASGMKLLTPEQTLGRLIGIGYGPDDAALIMSINGVGKDAAPPAP